MARGDIRLGRLFYEIESRTSGFDRDLKATERSLERFAAFVKANPIAVAGALGTALLGVAFTASQMAAEVDKAARRIATTLPEALGQVAQVSQLLRDEAARTGRPLNEIAQAATTIAREGTEGFEDLANRLALVNQLADASGADMATLSSGLDQVLDVFGLGADQAERLAVQLFAVSKGRVPLEDLLAVLAASARDLRDLGIDAATATAALAKLVDSGLSGRRAASEFKQFAENGEAGAASLRALAAALPPVVDGMGQLERAAALGAGSVERVEGKLREKLNNTLREMGVRSLEARIQFAELLNFLATPLSEFAIFRTGPPDATGTPKPTGTLDVNQARIRALQPRVPSLLEGTGVGAPPPETAEQQRDRLQREAAQQAAATRTREQAEREAATRAERQADLVAEAEQVAADLTTTLVDNLEQQLRRLRTRVREVFGDDVPAEIRAWLAELEAQIGRTKLLEGLDQQIADAQTRVEEAVKLAGVGFAGPALEAVPDLQALVDLASEEVEKTEEGTLARAEANRRYKESRDLLARILQLLGQAGQAEGENARHLQEQRQDAATLARTIEGAARGALQLASAFGLVDDELADVLGSIAQIAASIPSLVTEIKALGDAGGSPLKVLGAALPLLGGVASLASSIFGDSPEEQRRQDLLRQNNDRIAELTREIGGLGLVLGDVSGRQIVDVTGAIQNSLARGDFAQFGILPQELARLGLTMGDLREVAAGLGVELADATPNADELRQILAAIAVADLTQFAQTFGGQLEALRLEFELFDITDPIAQLRRLQELATGPLSGSVLGGLAGLDLSTAAGRAAAEAALQAIFGQLQAGTITPEQLGGLSTDQLVAILRDLEALLDQAAGGPGAGASQDFAFQRTVTEVTANQLLSVLVTQDTRLAQLVALAADRNQLLGVIAGGPGLTPPAIQPLAAGGGGAGGLTVTFGALTIQVTVPPGTDPVQAGTAAGEAVLATIDRGLEQRRQLKAYRAGSLEAVA